MGLRPKGILSRSIVELLEIHAVKCKIMTDYDWWIHSSSFFHSGTDFIRNFREFWGTEQTVVQNRWPILKYTRHWWFLEITVSNKLLSQKPFPPAFLSRRIKYNRTKNMPSPRQLFQTTIKTYLPCSLWLFSECLNKHSEQIIVLTQCILFHH